jgi:hypothetical protein
MSGAGVGWKEPRMESFLGLVVRRLHLQGYFGGVKKRDSLKSDLQLLRNTDIIYLKKPNYFAINLNGRSSFWKGKKGGKGEKNEEEKKEKEKKKKNKNIYI